MSKERPPKTFNIASSATVFLKYFLPTIWIVFFGTLLMVFLFAKQLKIGSMSPMTFKIVYSVFFFGMIALMYFTIFKLKRVEIDEKYLYITNYLKIYRYSFDAIESITKKDYGYWLFYTIELKQAGYFGKKSKFLANRSKITTFMKEHPDIAVELKLEDLLKGD